MRKVIRKSRLVGEVSVSGAKNSSLRLLAASLLTSETLILENVPTCISDFQIHLKMLRVLGKEIVESSNRVVISERNVRDRLEWDGRSIRNTLLILGSLLTRTGKGAVPLPGGCKLGERKYDLHIMAMERLGARVWEEGNYLMAECTSKLQGADIYLPIRSTGATENSILMGCLAKGKTTIWNPHVRPEIIDLISMLNAMGADITVYGQQSIVINGVEGLSGIEHRCISDNMEAITFAIGAALTGGEVEIHNFPINHLEVPLVHLRESGLKYYRSNDDRSIIIKSSTVYPIDIATGPYPGINSDMQPLFAAFAMQALGKSTIVDLRFPGRYQYAREFNKLGGSLSVEGDMLVIEGGNTLEGTLVRALDLRAGAALILCGLVSDGQTIIENFEQVTRGYQNITMKLKALGVDIDEH